MSGGGGLTLSPPPQPFSSQTLVFRETATADAVHGSVGVAAVAGADSSCSSPPPAVAVAAASPQQQQLLTLLWTGLSGWS